MTFIVSECLSTSIEVFSMCVIILRNCRHQWSEVFCFFWRFLLCHLTSAFFCLPDSGGAQTGGGGAECERIQLRTAAPPPPPFTVCAHSRFEVWQAATWLM